MRVEESKANEDLEVDMNDLVSRQVYDFENKKISCRGRRATEWKNNTHIYLPRAAVIKWETSIQMRRDRLLEVAQEYGRNIVNCSGTLTKEERAGLESLQKRIKDNELVVVETDNSGKFSVMRQD